MYVPMMPHARSPDFAVSAPSSLWVGPKYLRISEGDRYRHTPFSFGHTPQSLIRPHPRHKCRLPIGYIVCMELMHCSLLHFPIPSNAPPTLILSCHNAIWSLPRLSKKCLIALGLVLTMFKNMYELKGMLLLSNAVSTDMLMTKNNSRQHICIAAKAEPITIGV
jgi:hypothetical protein